MKKILTLALCLGIAGAMQAQKSAVDQASKMSGKADKLTEARGLIDQATKNPETQNQARTYYVGGKIEFDAYDNARTKQMINPNDESINPVEMSKQLINGYKRYMQALPLDSVPNEKGQIKPKFSKDIIKAVNGHYNDYFNAGGTFYNNKMYYPEAYEAFMIYGDLPKSVYADKIVAAIPDSVVNTSYFNAGLSAYAGNALPQSVEAFKKARLNNTDNPQNYIYEIACWQYMAQNDSTVADQAKKEIEEIAMAGYNKFGISQMLFINNLVNSWMLENRAQDALNLVSEQIAKNPENASLYGLRGYIYDQMDNDDSSINDYRKAASFDNADYDTLLNASKKLFKTGTTKLNAIEGNDPAARNAVKKDYFEAAKTIGERAKALNPNGSDIENVLESIDYALTTYFN